MLNFMRSYFICLAIIISSPLSADTEFKDSVPLSFAEGLMSGPDLGQPTFYSDIISSFPKFDLPEQFELLGSADLVYGTRLILRSDLNTEDAREILANKLLDTEFIIVPKNNDIQKSAGFITLDWPVLPLTFCHDNYGSVLARFRNTDSDSIITLDHSLTGPSNNSLNCTEYVSQRLQEVTQYETSVNQGLRIYEPRVLFPQPRSDEKMSRGTGVSGTGSDDYYESTTALVTDWSIAEVYKHFADQINAQGWELRSENTIGNTTVGVWANRPDADIALVGTFTVQRTNVSRYSLVFRLDRNLYIQNNGSRSPFRSQVR